MNSLFNYELDERQIRLTLHDAELDYSDASWMEFDNEYPAELSKQSKLAQLNFPKISLNINRNVLVPIFFIVALGSVSAIMFKFIDFKANKTIEAERALESDHSNLNAGKKATAFVTKKATPVQKPSLPASGSEITPAVITPSIVVNNSAAVTVNSASTQVANPIVQQKTETAKQQYTEPVTVQKNNSLPDTAGFNSQKTTLASADQDKPPVHTIYYKKRRKKLVVEQVETIKAPSLLSAQAIPAEEEQELKIKQN